MLSGWMKKIFRSERLWLWQLILGWAWVFPLVSLTWGSDFDADGLPDEWEAKHGLRTQGLTPDIVGWWQMDDASQNNVADRTNHHLDGMLHDFASFPFVTGLFSNALEFTDHSYVSFDPINDVLNVTNFTISVWFRGSPTGEKITLARWSDHDANEWELAVNPNGAVQLQFSDSASNTQTVSGGSEALVVTDDQWHHLAGVYDQASSHATVYIDGLAEASITIAHWAPSSVKSFTFGKSPLAAQSPTLHSSSSPTPSPSSFLLDEVRLYNIALSSNEIPQLPATYDDPDGDGLSNLEKYQHETSPLVANTDGNGITNSQELTHGTDSTNPINQNITFYVNNTMGSDGYDGFSPTINNGHGPKRTITKTIEEASNGDTIEIAPGSYSETKFVTTGMKNLTLKPNGLTIF